MNRPQLIYKVSIKLPPPEIIFNIYHQIILDATSLFVKQIGNIETWLQEGRCKIKTMQAILFHPTLHDIRYGNYIHNSGDRVQYQPSSMSVINSQILEFIHMSENGKRLSCLINDAGVDQQFFLHYRYVKMYCYVSELEISRLNH